ncbi:DegT/DnrJ/EryC1/StrS family aminotransferase [Knoellia sp. CPCC 206435]|uniref:DegT/DnrJ/EryC1/StrS family aminotransferase n=1 Tax=Knoellia terrae TaxID=3404797 RepID=UPI003B430C0E
MSTRTIIAAAQPLIGEEERAAVDKVLASGMLAQGPEVAAFESEFAEHFNLGRTCVALSSGTAGLHLGLLAAGIGPGDEVVVPSFTFAATANAVALTGATPVFADIDPDTYCLTADSVESHLTQYTTAVMPVHLYGHPADMTSLTELAERRGLRLFEDAAQAHGASWRGTPVGAFGEFAMFSLYPTKNMTSGEGGMVTVADGDIERRLRLLRNQGMETRYENEIVGYNARMTDIHAAIGREQLRKVGAWTSQRQHNAQHLSERIEGVAVPRVVDGAVHVFHQYTIRVPEDRDGFAQALLDEHGVATGAFYRVPTHRLPAFAATADLPETMRAADEVLSLPVHPGLSEADLDHVVHAVNNLVGAGA